MIKADKILKEFRITEKAGEISANYNQYTFIVHPDSSKSAIAKAIEKTFSVSVTRVNTLNSKGKVKQDRARRGKPGVKNAFKKAIVTLKEGDKINFIG